MILGKTSGVVEARVILACEDADTACRKSGETEEKTPSQDFGKARLKFVQDSVSRDSAAAVEVVVARTMTVPVAEA